MFSKEFKDAVGTSRRAGLITSVLEQLKIRFDGAKHDYTIYFPRDLAELSTPPHSAV